MAKLQVIIFLSLTVATVVTGHHPDTMLQSETPSPHDPRPEKLSHIRFYFHDVLGGPNPTAVPVAQANSTSTSPTGFGRVTMIDDPLTVGPDLNSTLVGYAQGMYAVASQQELSLILVVNFAFVEGKYNGSSIAVLGRNPVMSAVREMPIVGGTGMFQFAHGYVQARTYSINQNVAIVEYNVFVQHY